MDMINVWNRFNRCSTIEDCIYLLDVYIKFISELEEVKVNYPDNDRYARIILQIFRTKIISLKSMLNGIIFQNSNDIFYDFTTIIPHCRTIYELLVTFEVIYVLPDTNEKKLIMFNLWVVAGLKNRQQIISESLSEKQKTQIDDEALNINERLNNIRLTSIYNKSELNKKRIEEQIKQKKYYLYIDEKEDVKPYTLTDISSAFSMNRESIFKFLYNYYSMSAHSSSISIVQFPDLCKEHVNAAITAVNNVFYMCSIFLTDYLKVFPELKQYFFNKDIENQMLLRMSGYIISQEKTDLDKNWYMQIFTK